MNIADLIKRSEKIIVDNAPAILTGIGMTGTVVTAYLAARASHLCTLKNLEEDAHRQAEGNGPFTTKELLVRNAPAYIPAAAVGTVTITCVFFANRIDAKRAAALVAAYSVAEKRYSEYKDKVSEKFGEKKEEEVREEIAKDHAKKDYVQTIILQGDDFLCFDSYSARYFRSNMQKIEKAVNEINYEVIHERCAKLSDFWDKLGLDITDFSEELGWTENSLLEVSTKTITSSDGRPTLMISYEVQPIRRYNHHGF